jgi:hypothetical protein
VTRRRCLIISITDVESDFSDEETGSTHDPLFDAEVDVDDTHPPRSDSYGAYLFWL